MPWQQHVADVAYELEDDGRLVYSEIDLTVPRQSGKTRLILAKSVHRLTAMVRLLGPQRSIYTAQRRLDARKKLEMDFAVSLRATRAFREVPNAKARPQKPTQWRLSLNNGLEHIQFGTSSYLMIDAPTSTGGHGDTLDDGTIDEAWAQKTDDIEGAIVPAQATRRNAQVWVPSTAGDEFSFYLWRKILAGRAACENDSHEAVAYFEWSAEPDAKYDDPKTWALCSPALGYTIDISFLEREWARALRKGSEGINTFRRAYLNQWPVEPVLDEEDGREISPAAWAKCFDKRTGPIGEPEFALDVSPDRGSACIAVSAESACGGTHLEVVAHPKLPGCNLPYGTAWVVPEAVRIVKPRGGRIGVAQGSPAMSLVPELEEAGLKVEVISVAEHAQACGSLADAVTEKTARHRGDPPLEQAVLGAVGKPYGDAWLWSRKKSGADIAPLVAVTLARWLHVSKDRKPVFSY